MNAVESFRAEMERAGLKYGDLLHTDGKLHRVKVEGDHQRNSWYVFHPDPPCAGAFGCWKRGIKETWCERQPRDMSQAEWDKVRDQWRRADAEAERDRQERQAKAQKTAGWIISKSVSAVGTHPYLTRKGVKPSGGLRQWRDVLVIPLCDINGNLSSLQFIGTDGQKRFLWGGAIQDRFFILADKPDGPLVICEGYATGASIHEATGHAVTCAMNAGNILAVAKVIRAKNPEREIIIAGDNDQWTAGNPGITKATFAAGEIRAKLAIPRFTDTTSRPSDFNDLHQLQGLDAVRDQISKAVIGPAAVPRDGLDVKFNSKEEITRLAALDSLAYEQVRRQEAERLNCRQSVLDNLVKQEREKLHKNQFTIAVIPPAQEATDGAQLLDQIRATIRQYVILSDIALTACALFTLHTYAFSLGDISPILFISGPTKRCGKSRLLSVLRRLVNRPLAASSASAAAIYRTIELCQPTLLIDEVDSFLKGDEQLRGLINSGHTRDAAFHLGCATVGNEIEPRRWSTWAPKIFSGIGRLADTIEDRSIIIPMRRKMPTEPVDRLRHNIRFDDLQGKCARFVEDHSARIAQADPSIPQGLNDRAADNWMPLLILADLAGGGWPERARTAALELSGGAESEALEIKGQLLADIRTIFDETRTDRLASKDLCDHLAGIEGRPWAEFGKTGKPISPYQLANQLREFGITSGTIRIGDHQTPKGYYLAAFEDAFSRYCPGNDVPKRNTATTPVNTGENSLFENATPEPCGGCENSVPPRENGPCGVVADEKPESGGKDISDPELVGDKALL